MQTVAVLQHLLPGYEFISMIGHGLGGDTWLARGPDGLVAVKILSQRKVRSTPAFAQMLGEAMVLTTVKHPNVVPYLAFVHDSGKGVAALVMRYIPGGDLEAYVHDKGPFDSREVAQLGMHLVSALEALHTAGYLHRDLKPRNVLVEATDNGGRTLFLADFGISQPLVDGVAQARFQALTPGYAAPEQWHTVHLGQSIDVYALGAVFWYMYTGLHPGEREDMSGPDAAFEASPPRALASRMEDPADLKLCRLMADMMADESEGRPSLPEVHGRLKEIQGAPRPMSTWGTELFPDGLPGQPHGGSGSTQTIDPDPEPAVGAETLALFEAQTVVTRSPLLDAPSASTRKAAPQQPPISFGTAMALGAMAVIGAAIGLGLLQLAWRPSSDASRPGGAELPGAEASDANGSDELLVVPEGAFTWQTEPSSSSGAGTARSRTSGPTASPSSSASAPPTPAQKDQPSADPAPTTPAAPTAAPLPGTLSVNVSRGWAKVYVDGTEVETTPLADYKLPAGAHVVRVVRPDGTYDETKTITVRPGRDERVTFDLP